MRKIGQLIAIIFIATATISCTRPDVFNDYRSMCDHDWQKDSMAVFRADIQDTTVVCDIFFQVRNENDYPYSNLWLFVEAVAPNGDAVTDTVECTLAAPDGRWIGQGWGSLFSSQHLYRRGVRFAQRGVHTFRIRQGMRSDELCGINAFGLRIAESDTQVHR